MAEQSDTLKADTAFKRIERYEKDGYNAIGGWVDPQIFLSLKAILKAQTELQVTGGVYEIGVLEGRFFLALDQLREAHEWAVAIDLFDAQDLNIDGSGAARLGKFRENVERYSANPQRVEIFSQDSTMISLDLLADLTRRCGLARLFSVDGGHTVEHTVNDLRIAQRMIINGGVIFLDDYFNSSWPGVHEGFARFMMFESPKIVPFAYAGNKLMLTTLSRCKQVADHFLAAIRDSKGIRLRKVRMYGYDVILVR